MQLADVEQQHVLSDDVMGHVPDIVNGHVSANVTRNHQAVGYSRGCLKVVVFENYLFETGDSHHSHEVAVLDEAGVKRVGDEKQIPVIARVAHLHQRLYFVRMQATPVRLERQLLVAKIEFVLALGKESGRDESSAELLQFHHANIAHRYLQKHLPTELLIWS